jgi:hypothetical protein
MEGKIWVESNGPAGTGMYFSIPVIGAGASKVTLNNYNNTRIAI